MSLPQPAPGTLPAQITSARQRAGILKRLRSNVAAMNTATLQAMHERHRWFLELDAESRSWITVLARTGIDGFVTWVAGEEFSASQVFGVAPRAMAGRISLRQTVDLVRTTTEVLEEQIQLLLPRADRPALMMGVVHYSREVAFAAASTYARAAESRGAWDSRIEATIVDAVVRAETNDAILSRASTLGWNSTTAMCVVIAGAPPELQLDGLRRAASRQGFELLAAPQGRRLVCLFGGQAVTDPIETCERIGELEQYFATGPVVVGPIVPGLNEAHSSARAAASGFRAAIAWPEGPRTLLAQDLLPERVLSGDGHARRMLAQDIYAALEKSKELLHTCIGFLDSGSSIEATARSLYVHPNTVRYRLKRIQEITGYNPTDPRDAYVLRLTVTLGRLQQAQ